MSPYVIFFSGLRKLIDRPAAQRLAASRGAEAVFFTYERWSSAANYVSRHDARYHVVGFSRGGAPDVMGGFMRRIRANGWRLPDDIITVGLYSGTRRYADPHYECINFLDCSGRKHVGEHNAYDLGAEVEHLGPDSAMARVADLFGGGASLATIVTDKR